LDRTLLFIKEKLMDIKIYIRTSEPWSQSLVDYLRSRNMKYTKIEVTVDQEGYREMLRISGQKRVPVVVIEDQVLVGFNRRRNEELLGEEISTI